MIGKRQLKIMALPEYGFKIVSGDPAAANYARLISKFFRKEGIQTREISKQFRAYPEERY